MEHLSPHATVSGNDSVRGATSKAYLNGESKPGILCDDQGHGCVRHVQHQGVLCSVEGCDREVEVVSMSRVGGIDLFCSAHQSPDVIIARTEACQFTGCFHSPKYGQREGPLSFCQHHKRAGMYTIRNGQLFVAMRDGSAFRDEDGTKAVGADKSTRNFAIRKEIHYDVVNRDTTAISAMGFRRTGGEPNAPSERRDLQSFGETGLQVSAKPVSLRPGRAQDKTTPSRVMAEWRYRKMCEVTGCRIQPSYGLRGTSRPRFCSSHKKDGMVGLKNRPCIFPGCSTRPHYGLLGCRPIYCAKHKEADMVHLLKEAARRGNMGVKRDLGRTIRTTLEPISSESRHRLSAKRSKEEKRRRYFPKHKAKNYYSEDNEELDSRKGVDAASPLPLPLVWKQQKNEKEESGKVGTHCRRNTASSIQSASSSLTSTSTPSSSSKLSAQVRASVELGDPGKCGALGSSPSLSEKKPSSILADTLGVTPSLEIQVLNDIKGSEQTEAKTINFKTRVRVPSRKVLEASGKLKPEGVQWLTKEKKKEEAQRMKEIKAQRKAAATIGLRAGHVIEIATIDPEIGGERADTDGSCAGDVTKAELAKIRWRKLSPEEIVELSARKPIPDVNKNIHPGVGGQVASRAGGGNNRGWGDSANDVIARTPGGKRKEIVWYPQSNARAITSNIGAACPEDAKRRKESYEDLSAQTRQVMPSVDGKEPREVPISESTGNDTISTGVGEVGGMKMCQFDGCEKKATFGVNGIVRYCKLHAIFGMRRINIPV